MEEIDASRELPLCAPSTNNETPCVKQPGRVWKKPEVVILKTFTSIVRAGKLRLRRAIAGFYSREPGPVVDAAAKTTSLGNANNFAHLRNEYRPYVGRFEPFSKSRLRGYFTMDQRDPLEITLSAN